MTKPTQPQNREDQKKNHEPESVSSEKGRNDPATLTACTPEVISADAVTREEERLKAYANLLDSAIRLPGGFRIGLDGIVGLVPGIGDLLGAVLSGYLIYGSYKLDIPRSVVARMILNALIEMLVGLIPIVGDVFDFVFKANERNARLLHAALDERKARLDSAQG